MKNSSEPPHETKIDVPFLSCGEEKIVSISIHPLMKPPTIEGCEFQGCDDFGLWHWHEAQTGTNFTAPIGASAREIIGRRNDRRHAFRHGVAAPIVEPKPAPISDMGRTACLITGLACLVTALSLIFQWLIGESDAADAVPSSAVAGAAAWVLLRAAVNGVPF